mgnify:CR=1 FL=1
MVRWLTAGESHGAALVAIIEGLLIEVAGEKYTLPMASVQLVGRVVWTGRRVR